MLAPEVVDLVALVRATASLSSASDGAVRVEGMTTLEAEVDLQAQRQALENLLANARKFSPLVIHVDKEDERFACLRIRDFGPGVPPELLPSRGPARVSASTCPCALAGGPRQRPGQVIRSRSMVRPLLASLLLVGCMNTPSPVAPTSTPAPPPSATRDFDADGFMDPQDRCPREAGPGPLGCPERDSDGDRVPDSKDSCPKAAGTAADGCADRDVDGVSDQLDPCPNKAEVRNGYLDKDGCPDDPPKDLARLTGVVTGVQFETDNDVLKPASYAVLDRAIKTLIKYPEVRIEISGHTDSMSSADVGRDLSTRRAEAVKKYLVEHGVDEKRLETRGAATDEPIDTNKTAAGRARNRRIEFMLLVD